MDYNQALDYIRGRSWQTAPPDLDRTRTLLTLLGNPEKTLRFVHIAGTNGKGSVAAMTASILRNAGNRTGLYTSPSIQKYNERVQVNGVMIPDEDFAALVTDDIYPNAESMPVPPTEFEMLVCLALLWFSRQDCDVVVLEAGLGGELDSTNAIPCPDVAVITAIGLDHTALLGDTIEQIARNKAGIIKHGCDVVLNGNSSVANEIIRDICAQRDAGLVIPDYTMLTKSEMSFKGQYFSYKHYNDLFIPLLGDYQPQNAAVAIETILALKRRGWTIDERNVRDGLRETVWPGRFELLCSEPVFIADGAHNPQGIQAAVDSIERIFPNAKPIVMIGAMADKDIDGMLPLILVAADSFVCVTPDNPRAIPAQELADRLRGLGARAVVCDTVPDGITTACMLAKQKGCAVVALGSLYMVGMIRTHFKG